MKSLISSAKHDHVKVGRPKDAEDEGRSIICDVFEVSLLKNSILEFFSFTLSKKIRENILQI
jgi:hypothetical protein